MRKLLSHVLKAQIINFNGTYFTGHQGILISACMNRTGGDL